MHTSPTLSVAAVGLSPLSAPFLPTSPPSSPSSPSSLSSSSSQPCHMLFARAERPSPAQMSHTCYANSLVALSSVVERNVRSPSCTPHSLAPCPSTHLSPSPRWTQRLCCAASTTTASRAAWPLAPRPSLHSPPGSLPRRVSELPPSLSHLLSSLSSLSPSLPLSLFSPVPLPRACNGAPR
jgi:hypothetical protein